jgi:hypothetical protein
MMRQANVIGASDANSVIAMLDYIRPEIRHIDPIAAFFVSVSMGLLNGKLRSLDYPRGGCKAPQDEPRDKESGPATENHGAPRRSRVLRLPRLSGL